MARFVILRILRAAITLWIVLTAVFALTRISGNPFEIEFAEVGLTEEVMQRLNEKYGLDKPVVEQYFIYLREVLKGNFGYSIMYSRPVAQLYTIAFRNTLKLVLWAIPIGPLVGIPLGTIGALKRRTAVGQLSMMIAFAGYAVPGFIIAIAMILVFSFFLHWLPSTGDTTARHFIMPVLVLAASHVASMARYTRSTMLDVMSQDYVRTARGKGLRERIVIFKHALRNVLIPVVTVFGMQVAGFFTGQMITETIFSWPGMGRLMINSVMNRDYPVVQFGVVLIAGIVITMNLIVDVLYGVIDPRIRTEA